MLRKIQVPDPANRSLLRRQWKLAVVIIALVLVIALWQPIKNKFLLEDDTIGDEKAEFSIEKNEPIGIESTIEVPTNAMLSEDQTGNDIVDEYIFSSGDSLAKVLESYGIGFSEVVGLTKKYPALENNLRPGQVISWSIDDEGHLQTLTWTLNRKESRVYERSEEGFIESIEMIQGESREFVLGGAIGDGGNNNFIGSAQYAGLMTSERYNAARFLEYQVSFKGLRLGDKFSVLIEREFVNKEYMDSRFLAAKIHNRGRDNYAIYFEKYGGYYDEKGSPLADGFLRIPTRNEKKYRISSHFNPMRRHPVTGRVAPHNGVDFAVPVGTPIVASGDGEILISRYSSTAGNYIAIRHGKQYATRYMHLSKLLVKPGQIVKRGDTIGLSGNTGRSTGPHLHYEFLINNKPVNPITISLPRPEGLRGEDLTEFLAYVKQVQEKLANPTIREPEAELEEMSETGADVPVPVKINAPAVTSINPS